MVKVLGPRRWTESVANIDFGSWHSTCVLSVTPVWAGHSDVLSSVRKGGQPSRAPRKLGQEPWLGGFCDCNPVLRVPADGTEMNHLDEAGMDHMSVCRVMDVS